ncbi:MAG: hypothetical protein ACRDUT_02625 [Mycobacterium sp.]
MSDKVVCDAFAFVLNILVREGVRLSLRYQHMVSGRDVEIVNRLLALTTVEALVANDAP